MSFVATQKKRQEEEQKKRELEDNNRKTQSVTSAIASGNDFIPTEGRTNNYIRLRKTSDTDEISLLFEDALEYQDDDIDDILAELAASNDEGTLKGYSNKRGKMGKSTTFHVGEMLNLGSFQAEYVDKSKEEEDSESEKEIMIDTPPYVNIPPPMKKIADIVMPPYELEYHMKPLREDAETIATPGCATIGHSPTYQRSAFDAYRQHRPQSFDGGTMENQQVDIKLISRLPVTFFLDAWNLLLRTLHSRIQEEFTTTADSIVTYLSKKERFIFQSKVDFTAKKSVV